MSMFIFLRYGGKCDISIRQEKNKEKQRGTYLFGPDLAFTSLDNLVQVLLDGVLEAARDLVGILVLLALDAGHCRCVTRSPGDWVLCWVGRMDSSLKGADQDREKIGCQ